MRIYLSGWQASKRERELAVIKSGYLKHRCFSFASTQKIPGLPYFLPHIQGSVDACIENKVGIMMDSGVVGYRSYKATLLSKGKSIDKLPTEDAFIQLYVDYIKATKQHYDFYVTIDLERKASAIYDRHCRIEKMGIKPVPVYHGDDDAATYIKKYADLGHKLISVASWKTIRTSKKQFTAYFDTVFNLAAKLNVDIHGLAMTAPRLMIGWPFWSVDSSSWSRAAGYGSITTFDEQKHRMSTFHISNRASEGKGEDIKLNSRMMGQIKEQVEAEGFSFEELQNDFVQRHIWNAKAMLKLATYATKRHGGKISGWKPIF